MSRIWNTAWNDYEIVAANLFDNDARRVSERIPCYAHFIDPALRRRPRQEPPRDAALIIIGATLAGTPGRRGNTIRAKK